MTTPPAAGLWRSTGTRFLCSGVSVGLLRIIYHRGNSVEGDGQENGEERTAHATKECDIRQVKECRWKHTVTAGSSENENIADSYRADI